MLAWRAPFSSRLVVFADRYQAALACGIAIAFLMALHQSYNLTEMHFDSAQYWWLADLNNLGSSRTARGYVFPALLSPLRHLCAASPAPVLTYRLGMSIIYGVSLTVLVPAAFVQAFGGRLTLVRRLVPLFLLAALFPGVLLYTLSDLPAVLLALAALTCALRALKVAGSRSRFVALLIASGVFMGAAYNTRTIYLFAGIPLGLLAVVTLRGRWATAPFPRWLGLASFVLGMLLVSLPQLAVNRRTHGINSLAVQSVVNNKGLFASQMVWGMTLQRYETTLNAEARVPQVFYFDPAGAQLFGEAVNGGDVFSLPYYLKFVAQHPLEFMALYARHVINGLDVRDGMVYTLKPSPLRNRTAMFNFLVLALAAWVTFAIRERSAGPRAAGAAPVPASWPVSLAVLALPVAAIVPGAIETRFFLPVHLLAYCVIAMHFDVAKLRASLRRHAIWLVLSLVLAAGVFFAVTLNTMANLRSDWPEIYRSGPQR